MEQALALLASPVGQALASAGISQVMTLINGGDPVTAAATFAEAVSSYQDAVKAWQAAEAAAVTQP